MGYKSGKRHPLHPHGLELAKMPHCATNATVKALQYAGKMYKKRHGIPTETPTEIALHRPPTAMTMAHTTLPVPPTIAIPTPTTTMAPTSDPAPTTGPTNAMAPQPTGKNGDDQQNDEE
jgi:hypothetical protein